jgi:small-conductance mechanosensitive channel
MIQLDRRIFQHHLASTPPSSNRWMCRSWYWPAISMALMLLIATMSCAQAIAENLQPTASPAKTANPSSQASAAGKNTAGSKLPGSSTRTSSAKPGPGMPLASPQTPNAKPAAATVDSATVISYLGELISWYRQVRVEDRLATEPAETLFVADDRQNANRILDLGFQYADAAAKIVDSEAPAPVAANSASNSSKSQGAATANLSNLTARRTEAQSTAAAANNNVQRLKHAMDRARGKQRDVIAHQLATAQAELALAQSQVDAMSALINFENGSGAGSDLQARIDQLRAAVTGKGKQNGAQPGTSTAEETQSLNVPRSHATASGIVGLAEGLFALTQKSQELDNLIELTNHMQAKSEQVLTPLHNKIRNLSQRMLELAAGSTSSNLTVVKDTQTQVAKLITEHKLVVAAVLPLSMQTIAFTQYEANLQRWRSTVTERSRAELRNLLLRLGGLLVLLIAIVGGAALWRRMTFRYVHDIQRRYQLLWLSRIVVVAIIALVLLFSFANELGALATVMGFAAAGIALTLQNVILSFAGYFYISGRYGIRVGDRVQISGISGDVIEIGLFKMTLMELGSDGTGQPTGRVTVFPNSVVFQPSGSFSKQLPGSDFAWHELRLTLAPECDYRLAERRLLDIVNDVFRRYRDALQREYRGLERNLNQPIEPPRPQSRLRLSEAGIEIVIRYPVQFKQATQTADEIARRLVDALKQEPALKLVTPGTPMIQRAEVAEVDEPTGANPAKAGMPPPDSIGGGIEGRSAAAQKQEGLSAPLPDFGKR